MPLNPQRRQFAHNYVANGFNATQAAKDAGYSQKTAFVIGHELLNDAETWALVQELTDGLLKEAHLSAKSLLALISARATFNAQDMFEPDGTLKRISEMPEEISRSIQSIEMVELFGGSGEQKHIIGHLKKIKLTDKDKNTELLAKYHGILKEKVEHSGTVNFTLTPEDESL